MKRFDVVDFATPISSFDVTRGPNGTRIVVAAAGDFEQLAYQSDRDYVLEVRPRPKAAVVDPSKREYKGERLTLNFQDIETRAVLQLLAETSGQNIVVSDSVQGNVTLRLQNVPWDQALDIVLRTKGLDKRQDGNVIYVAPTDELQAREKQLLESQKAIVELSPVRTEYLQVNYAKASDLAALIKSQGKTLAPVRARQRVGGRPHEHPAAGRHRRAARRHPPPGGDARHPREAGADRVAHRDRERQLRPRARRALRQRLRERRRQRRHVLAGQQRTEQLPPATAARSFRRAARANGQRYRCRPAPRRSATSSTCRSRTRR